MPLRVSDEDKGLQGTLETALVQGLQQRYEVLSGELVAKKAKEVFDKETRSPSKTVCDETKCMQSIAAAFQAELIASSIVTKRDGGYYLALSIQNIFDNKIIYVNSIPCERCNTFQVVSKLKQLIGPPTHTVLTQQGESADTNESNVNFEETLWAEVKKGNSTEDYGAYLQSFPQGKYSVFAKNFLSKLRSESLTDVVKQDQVTWNTASNISTVTSYQDYLKNFPKGQYATLASSRVSKLKRESLHSSEQATKAGKVIRDCPECPEMIVIPAGSFNMGSYDGTVDEQPPHRVTISKPFALGKTEITRGQFTKFVNETNYDAGNVCGVYTNKWEKISGRSWRNPGYPQDDSHPVACISLIDARAYTAWLSRKTGQSYQLPTEAQWEYACRAGGQDKYCGGNNEDSVAWYGKKNGNSTHPAAQKKANFFGLYDMSGNVWEWTEDSYHKSYSGAPVDGAAWEGDGSKRVLRGGSWNSDTNYLRSTFRYNDTPNGRDTNDGFRVARML